MSQPFRRLALAPRSAPLIFPRRRAQTMGTPSGYTASAFNHQQRPGPNIDITVNRWSSDKQRDALIRCRGPEGTRETSRALRSAGHGPLRRRRATRAGHPLRRKMPLPDGGERVISFTDAALASGNRSTDRDDRLPVHGHRACT
jgi:hypothetical protein